MFSPQELIDDYYFYKDKVTPNILNIGLKKKIRKNVGKEKVKIKECQENLRRLISLGRIARFERRSIANLSEDRQIHVTKKCGSKLLWTSDALELYGALQQVQMDRLEIHQNSVILSLEKAYCLLLSNSDVRPTAITNEQFLIYSKLMTFGYTIEEVIVDNYEDKPTSSFCKTVMTEPSFSSICTWAYLQQLLNLKKPPELIKNCSEFVRIKGSMDEIIKKISHQRTVRTESQYDLGMHTRRKVCKTITKVNKLPIIYNSAYTFSKCRLNDFMVGEEFHRFKNIFDRLDVISPVAVADITKTTRNTLGRLFAVGIRHGIKQLKNTKYKYKVVMLRKKDHIPTHPKFQILTYRNNEANIVYVYISQEFCFYSFTYRFM